jgi:hypothetical protein
MRDQAGHCPQQRCFAASVGAQNTGTAAGFKAAADVFKYLPATVSGRHIDQF